MYEGKLKEAVPWLQKALDLSRSRRDSAQEQAGFLALLGIAALRRGEIENCLGCVGPSSCIFPLAAQAIHRDQSGSREAITQLSEALKLDPGDLRLRWLLNIACMTVGDYPDKVPAAFLISPESFRSKLEVGRFRQRRTQGGSDGARTEPCRRQHLR